MDTSINTRSTTDRGVASKHRRSTLKRKRVTVKHNQLAKNATACRPDPFAFINIKSINMVLPNTLDIAYHQDLNPILGKTKSLDFLEHLHTVLQKNPNWKDTHSWAENQSPPEVILSLIKDLEQLKPNNCSLNIDHNDNSISLQSYFPYNSCFIDVSRFLTQLQKYNSPLFELVATVIGQLNVILKMDLWHADYEDQAMEYLENCLVDSQMVDWDHDQRKSVKAELDRWNNELIPLQDYCIELGRATSLNQIISAVEQFNWPDTLTAKRVYLWFQKAFKVLAHRKSLCWATPHNNEYDDIVPITPYEAYRFNWNGYKGIEPFGCINEQVQTMYNDHWGNGGQIELQVSTPLSQTWNIDQTWFKDLDNFFDASMSLWNEPEHRDVCNLKSVKTKRHVVKEPGGRTYIQFKPVCWKPQTTTL